MPAELGGIENVQSRFPGVFVVKAVPRYFLVAAPDAFVQPQVDVAKLKQNSGFQRPRRCYPDQLKIGVVCGDVRAQRALKSVILR